MRANRKAIHERIQLMNEMEKAQKAEAKDQESDNPEQQQAPKQQGASKKKQRRRRS